MFGDEFDPVQERMDRQMENARYQRQAMLDYAIRILPNGTPEEVVAAATRFLQFVNGE